MYRVISGSCQIYIEQSGAEDTPSDAIMNNCLTCMASLPPSLPPPAAGKISQKMYKAIKLGGPV